MKKLLFVLLLSGISITSSAWLTNETGSCARPSPFQLHACRQIEEKILATTVRILLHGYIEIEDGYGVQRINGTISHATIIEGRYLLTHNHFGIRLSQALLFDQFGSGGFSGVSVFRLNGEPILNQAPMTAFSVVSEAGETVLLDFGLLDGQGFFTQAGLASAEFATSDTMALQPGTEVAQIDWDRKGETKVIWTTIEDVATEIRLPLAQVDHFIELGASGGGVFLEGVHIGNSWSRTTLTNVNTGTMIDQFSLVALNTPSTMR